MIIGKMLDVMLIYIIYGEIERGNITQFVDADKIVVDYVTVDWCVTYKFNKILDLNSIRAFELFSEKNHCNMRRLYFPR